MKKDKEIVLSREDYRKIEPTKLGSYSVAVDINQNSGEVISYHLSNIDNKQLQYIKQSIA